MLLGIVLSSCQGFSPATARTLATVRAMSLAEHVPTEQFSVEIESSRLTGVFDAVCLVESARLRLQLFPDVGGKVLDLTLNETSLRAETPAGDYVAVAPLDQAEPHLALVLAGMLAELLAPVDGSRVLGQRGGGDVPLEVRLHPALGSGQVEALLGANGQIQRYRITLGWLEFDLRDDGTFSGPGFSGRLWP